MHDLHTSLYYLDDIERAARRDIAQQARFDRARTFGEVFADLMGLVARAFSPFGSAKPAHSGRADRS